MIRKIMVPFILILLFAIPAVMAEPITICGVETDTATEYLNLDKIREIEDMNAFLEALNQMDNLTKVDMFNCRISRDDMAMLFDGYPQIEWGWTIHIWEHTIRTDQTAFSTLHGSSPDPAHTEKDFQVLRYCTKLRALDLGHNWIEDISFLYYLPDLEVLILGRNQIKDITPIASLHKLVYVELFSNHIRDVSPLVGLTNLRDVNLSNNPIEDLTPLMGMTWVERLWLGFYMNYPKEQEEQIKAALPNTEFFWDWGPTAGTWREHPHYFELYSFFRTNEYIPFAE